MTGLAATPRQAGMHMPPPRRNAHGLAKVYPDRTVVGVPGVTIDYGGGGPHRITQQIPVGDPVAP